MLEIGQPIYLLSALGVLVPILIHLWNKKPPQLVQVGSIRWFKGSSAPAARRLQLKEIPLLLLRCFMLLIFSLLLAGLLGNATEEEKEEFDLWLVQPDFATRFSENKVDSLSQEGIQLRLLAPGLPMLHDSANWNGRRVDTWAVMAEADRYPGVKDTITLWGQFLQGQFSGSRPILRHQFVFRGNGEAPEAEKVLADVVQLDSMVVLRHRIAAKEMLRFEHDSIPLQQAVELVNENKQKEEGGSWQLSPPDTFRVRIVAEKQFQEDSTILRFAIEAAAAQIPELALDFTSKNESRADLLLYLKNDSLPQEWSKEADRLLLLSKDEERGEWLRFSKDNIYYLRERPLYGRVDREAMQSLPLAFMDAFFADRTKDAADFLPMPARQATPQPTEVSAPEWEESKTSFHEYLWILLMVLLTIERIWVYRS